MRRRRAAGPQLHRSAFAGFRFPPEVITVVTDKAGPHLRVLDELVPTAMHVTEQFANNRIDADHARC